MGYIDVAKQIEKEGIDHYRVLADQCQVKELAGIFEFFMQQEQRHYEIFDAWQKKAHVPELVVADVAQRANEAFRKLAADIKSLGVPAIDHDDAYTKALTLEKNSISMYTAMREKVDSPDQKQQLTFIIEQEELHLRLVESLMAFQRHPHEWLENAEWHHFDDY